MLTLKSGNELWKSGKCQNHKSNSDANIKPNPDPKTKHHPQPLPSILIFINLSYINKGYLSFYVPTEFF